PGGGAGGRALLRVDRRAEPDPGRNVLAAAVHASLAPEQVVEGQLRAGRAADRGGANEAPGVGRGRGGQGGRALGRGGRPAEPDRGARGAAGAGGGESGGARVGA